MSLTGQRLLALQFLRRQSSSRSSSWCRTSLHLLLCRIQCFLVTATPLSHSIMKLWHSLNPCNQFTILVTSFVIRTIEYRCTIHDWNSKNETWKCKKKKKKWKRKEICRNMPRYKWEWGLKLQRRRSRDGDRSTMTAKSWQRWIYDSNKAKSIIGGRRRHRCRRHHGRWEKPGHLWKKYSNEKRLMIILYTLMNPKTTKTYIQKLIT